MRTFWRVAIGCLDKLRTVRVFEFPVANLLQHPYTLMVEAQAFCQTSLSGQWPFYRGRKWADEGVEEKPCNPVQKRQSCVSNKNFGSMRTGRHKCVRGILAQ